MSQLAHRGNNVWWQCQTCEQDFTGAMQIGVAEAWRSRVSGQAAESLERLDADGNLADAFLHQGKYAQAERMLRDLHAARMRVLGAEHPGTLTSACNLAMSLSYQGKHAEAETIQREVLGVQKRVLGAEHPNTLTGASNLAMSLLRQGKYFEAEVILREELGVRKRVLGAEHPSTLMSANILAASLSIQDKHAEAEAILREVLGVQKPRSYDGAMVTQITLPVADYNSNSRGTAASPTASAVPKRGTVAGPGQIAGRPSGARQARGRHGPRVVGGPGPGP